MERATVKEIRTVLNRLLEDSDELKSMGLSVRVGNAKFTSTSVDFKVEIAEVSSDGTAMTKEAEAFESLKGVMFPGIDVSVGDSFVVDGRSYKIRGMRIRSHKYPIIADRYDGKGYKFPKEIIIRNFKKKAS